MANTNSANVLVVDTTGYTYSGPIEIAAIKYVGATASSASVLSAEGTTIWSESASTNVTDLIKIYDNKGISVTLTGTAKIYIYLKAR